MLSRRLLIPVVFAIAGLTAAIPAKADPAQDAAAFIDSFGHRAIDALTAPDLSNQQVTDRFQALFEEGFDVPYVARSALGVFWRRATKDEKAEFVPLFKEYIAQIYSGLFRQYKGETFKVKSGQPAGDDMIIVLSEVKSPDGPVTPVQWVVTSVNGKLKIRDVKIEGVSMVSTYRDQFANEILQRNGKVAGLIDALRQKTASLRTNGSG